MVGPLSHMDELNLQKGWRLSSSIWAVDHGAPGKTLDTKAGLVPRLASVGGNTPCVLSYINTRKVILLTTPQEEVPHLELS